MMLAFAAIEEALSGLNGINLAQTFGASFGMVLGTSLGELDVTQEFLGTLASSGVARPILFQSSLHNATIGLMSLHLGVTGPCLTVSGSHCTGEKALETAQVLLASGMVSCCLTVGVERQSQALAEPMRFLDTWGRPVSDGAGALILANEQGVKALGCKPLAYLDGVETAAINEMAVQSHHDSDAIEQIAAVVKNADNAAGAHRLTLQKPGGICSLINWHTA
jgi:3-oxoacyl-(acyl-carrier-protein) synthase